jgi:hypothetical protein
MRDFVRPQLGFHLGIAVGGIARRRQQRRDPAGPFALAVCHAVGKIGAYDSRNDQSAQAKQRHALVPILFPPRAQEDSVLLDPELSGPNQKVRQRRSISQIKWRKKALLRH